MEVIQDLMRQQIAFESSIVGTDGTLAQLNTPIFALKRGIIGEAEETIEALENGDLEHAKEEAMDVTIFLCTLFNHLGITYEEITSIASAKMETNRIKYYSDPDRDEGLTVAEIMAKRKREWNEIVIYESSPVLE